MLSCTPPLAQNRAGFPLFEDLIWDLVLIFLSCYHCSDPGSILIRCRPLMLPGSSHPLHLPFPYKVSETMQLSRTGFLKTKILVHSLPNRFLTKHCACVCVLYLIKNWWSGSFETLFIVLNIEIQGICVLG